MIAWCVEQMNCQIAEAGLQDVVFTVYWRCNGSEDNFYATSYSSCNVSYVAGEPFTPYASLTQDQVLGWIWSQGVDKNAVEASVELQLQTQINPTTETLANPWSA